MKEVDTVKTIPMLNLRREYEYMKIDIDKAIRTCLEHQQWILGPEVAELEEKVSAYLKVKHAIGTSSGTDSLVLALRALAIRLTGKEYFQANHQIMTTPLTFTATGDAILRSGGTPVFVDIDATTYNINPRLIRDYLIRHAELRGQDSTKVVGIIPVHLYGRPCQMDEIMAIAADYNLFVVEDCAQAFGASWNGKKVGSFGTCGTFSFFPSKNLGGFGDAGMVSTNDDEIAQIIRMLLKHGGKDKYNVEHVGYNARLDTLQAAILLAKLSHIDEFNSRRREVALSYTKALNEVEDLALPITLTSESETQDYIEHVFHQFTIRVLNGRRDAFQDRMKRIGIETMVYYPVPLHRMKVFGDKPIIGPSNLSAAEDACSTVLSLPIEPLQEQEETAYVIERIREFFLRGP